VPDPRRSATTLPASPPTGERADSVALAREVEARYLRYLKTTFYFRDPVLRESFARALNAGRLTKGPYLEGTPVFKRGQRLREIFRDLMGLTPDEGFAAALQGDRHLYWHQQQAIQKVCEGRNVVVATGTGSGKTEAFLYPILIHLYKEFTAGVLDPGVRALILYPMNALANDQRDRLGRPRGGSEPPGIAAVLEERASPFGFTFGQYTGETPDNENDSYRNARHHMASRLSGELVLRSDMRKKPPHILLTNYSMLEYLLLRPKDSDLFDKGRGQTWTFLVLDEAHQYRGSKGIEMAMLLRRLKRRLREGGRTGRLRCIATSATLARGAADKKAVAQFACDLFGEEFLEDDVILSDAELIGEPGPRNLPPNAYGSIKEVLDRGEPVKGKGHLSEIERALSLNLPEGLVGNARILHILQNDGRATRLRCLIQGRATDVEEVADEVFSDLSERKERVEALSDLVDVLLRVNDPVSRAPLLSARYHLFLRSLEGAFVSYWPRKEVFLERHVSSSEGEGHESTAFEVALCREGGQHYLVGKLEGGKLQEAIRDPGDPHFSASFFRPIEGNEYEDDSEDNDTKGKKSIFWLCLRCSEMWRASGVVQGPKCRHDNSILVMQEDPPKDEDRADQLARCSSCGYNASGRDPVREVIHGTDGPNAVIATTLHQKLPVDRRKVLAFADSRQEAAFFAWYLQDSYKDILYRNLILKTARALAQYAPEGLSLRELATSLRDLFRQRNVLPSTTGQLELLREAWLALYREFLTEERRISLEGAGLLRWSIRWPDWISVPDVLLNPPWSLGEQDARNLLLVLMDFMRADEAVELHAHHGVSISWEDLSLQAQQRSVRVGVPRRNKYVRSWDGKTGSRATFLARILKKAGFEERQATTLAQEALSAVWEALSRMEEPIASEARLFVRAGDAKRLNPDWWRAHLVEPGSPIFRCDICGRLQTISIRATCPRFRCPGTLVTQLARAEDNPAYHYRVLYEEDLPASLRVEEHTAQIDKEKAREFQREFKERKIHVLSCSTTFELGVDLGDLDTIFLRNVPPEAFNYAQRVGRAGRRSGFAGFAVTYCRRSPHDLYHFNEPSRMLQGLVRPPALSMRNEKIISRHIAATALSRFFRDFPGKFESVEKFFEDLLAPVGVEKFKAYLREHRDELDQSLSDVVPAEMVNEVGLRNGSWIESIAGDDSRLFMAETEVSSDFRGVKKLETEAKARGKREDLQAAIWAQDRASTIAGEDTLTFLSRKAVIPKYGFPVDVVELDPQRTKGSGSREALEVSLQRDLAIAVAEFAPTSKVVANKKLWTSYGLKRVPEREWDRRLYKRCDRHHMFVSWGQDEAEPAVRCCDRMAGPKDGYIDPQFGFVTNRQKPEDPKARPTRVFTTRPYFDRPKGEDREKIDFRGVITLTKTSPGYMVVLCEGRRGRGFYICGACGAGFQNRKQPHMTPYGVECPGKLENVSLGHKFVTDVLRLQFTLAPHAEGHLDPVWFAHSLAYALVEGAAHVLEVPTTDLSATVAYSSPDQAVPPIVLYDNVPGGAGLVARLEEEGMLLECLRAAKNRVSGECGCGRSASCYGCLRSFRNQFAHRHLKRGAVADYLDKLLAAWP